MAELLVPVTLRLYRHLRAGHPPEEALELLRGHVRVAREYAIAVGRLTLASELRDQEGHLTHWLQDVRVRQDAPGRFGRYWNTGQLANPLVYTVQAWNYGEPLSDPITCDNPGCAIKHALALFCDESVGEVTVDCNRPGVAYVISRFDTMAQLAARSWPVE